MENVYKNNRQDNQGGFTLLELLLVVGLTTTLIIGFGRLSTLWANRELAELSGIHMQRVTDVVEDYIRVNVANTVTPLASGDITAAIAAQLPTGMTMSNPLRRDLNVRLNITPLPNREYQALIYTNDAVIPYDRLLPASRAAGAAGGAATAIKTPVFTGVAESAFGLWTTNVAANFGGLALGVNGDGGQLVSYISLSLEEAFGPYLYRNDVGDADRNTMFTDLNMNGNAIRAAGAVDVDDMEVNTSATVQQLQVDGGTTFEGSVDIDGTLNVADQVSVANDVTVANGDLIVGDGSPGSGNIDAESMTVNAARASVINAPDISATGINISGADSVLVTDVSVTGAVLIDGEIQANTLNANQVNAQTVQSDQMTVNNNVTVNGDATIRGSAVVDVMAVDDCVTIQPGGLNDQYGPGC